jgi:carbonic anhydrase
MTPDLPITRRQLVTAAAAAGAQPPPAPEPFPASTAAAVERLRVGNRRFVAGTTRHAHEGAEWRRHLVGEQRPFATILGCSDSRVPVELVFDQGFGDLFVIRVAGNVIAADVVGSVAYAGLHLRTPVFVVLGHSGCGAVTAAVDEKLKKAKEPGAIEALIRLIDPGLRDLDLTLPAADRLAAAVEANVRWSVRQLAALPGAREAVERHRAEIVGAVYELRTGVVRFLP